MAINNDTAVIIPAISAVAEITYPHIWLKGIQIRSESASSGVIDIDYVPYDGDTLEIVNDYQVESIRTSELWTAVSEVSAVAIAMQAIFDAVEPLRTWLEGREP